MEKRYWFKAKKYGYGWYPATWEGWAVMAVWFAAFVRLVTAFIYEIEATQNADAFLWYLPLMALITGALLFVAWLTGEPARWRWGDDK